MIRLYRWFIRRAPWNIWALRPSVGVAFARMGLRHGEGFRVLQIGAHLGNDALREPLTSGRWRGLLVEPIPALCERLAESYRAADVTVVNAAVAQDTGTATIYTVDSLPSDPPWLDQVSSLDRAHVAAHLPDERIRAITVPAIDVPTLLAVHDFQPMFVMIDTEGYDLEVLRQLPLCDLAYLLYEHRHLDDDDRATAESLLRAAGFRFVRLRYDTFAWARSRRRRPRGAPA